MPTYDSLSEYITAEIEAKGMTWSDVYGYGDGATTPHAPFLHELHGEINVICPNCCKTKEG